MESTGIDRIVNDRNIECLLHFTSVNNLSSNQLMNDDDDLSHDYLQYTMDSLIQYLVPSDIYKPKVRKRISSISLFSKYILCFLKQRTLYMSNTPNVRLIHQLSPVD